MKTRLTKLRRVFSRGRMLPALFCLTLLIVCHTSLPGASAWFTAKADVDLNRRSALPSGAGSAGVGFRASLSDTFQQELDMGAESVKVLLLDVVDGDFEMAEYRLVALSQDTANEESEDGYISRAFKIRYTFTYEDDDNNFPEVYVRFQLSHRVGNLVVLGGSERECVQTLRYGKDGDFGPMPRMSFSGQGTWYYYPLLLTPGDTVELEYLLFLPGGLETETIDGSGLLRYEIIQASNNASVFQWNILFEDGTAEPFDAEKLMDTSYVSCSIELSQLENTDSSQPEPPAPQPGGPGGESTPPEPEDEEEPPETDGEEQTLPDDGEEEETPPEGGGESPSPGGDTEVPEDPDAGGDESPVVESGGDEQDAP